MKQFETSNYIFYYDDNSLAAKDIEKIACCQENCFKYICMVLKTKPTFKIRYFLCETPERVGEMYGDNEPCNGFASVPDKIYAVYNNNIKCIGYHEDAHLISYTINRPDNPFIREGLAMYFDKDWWKINNYEWCKYYIKNGKFINLSDLLDKEYFFDNDCELTYPIAGAFTDYIINLYGLDAYLNIYRENDSKKALEDVLKISIDELNFNFIAYVQSFKLDVQVEKRIKELLENV